MHAPAATRRRRLLIISQVYVPDSAAVGQCLADAGEEMARRGWNVVVYTSARGYDDPAVRYPQHEARNGVQIRRLPLSSFGKKSIAIRLLAQCLFMAQAFLHGLCLGRVDAVLVSTSPPFAGFFGAVISRLRNAPLVWWVMDLNPDQMVVAGKLAPASLLVRTFDWMNRVTLRRASRVVVLDDYMRDRVCSKTAGSAGRISVIPPWAQTEAAFSVPDSGQAFRMLHGLLDKFVIMYSGNHALQHPLDTLLDAAQAFDRDDRVVFVFVGGGAGKALVESRIAAGAHNLRSLPYQPLHTLSASLSAADLHVVSMGNDMVGIVHPCKIYGVMAIGRPSLYFGPKKSHAGILVASGGIGWQVAHGDVRGAIAAIEEAVTMPQDHLHAMGSTAAKLASDSFSRRELLAEFCDGIEQAAHPDNRVA